MAEIIFFVKIRRKSCEACSFQAEEGEDNLAITSVKPNICCCLRVTAFALLKLKMRAALVVELCLINKLLCSGSKICCEGKQSVSPQFA